MKIQFYLAVSLLVGFAAPSVFADGYVCKGKGYHAKVYHQSNPENGTRSPAVFVVSRERMGTLVAAKGKDIERITAEDTLIYETHDNRADNGRYAYAALEIFKESDSDFYSEDTYYARLVLNADHVRHRIKMVCERYTKHGQD